MNPYQDLITQFLFEAVPTVPVSADIRFEAISAAVIGTKQRRYGPMPKPEVQVAIRDVLRQSDTIEFFLPWASVKQDATDDLDIIEFMALKQLLCLKEELNRYGKKSVFKFRLEDLTDRWLLGDDRIPQIYAYRTKFTELAKLMLGGETKPLYESMCTTWSMFKDTASKIAPMFYDYLNGSPVSALQDIGWFGEVSEVQRNHYYDTYKIIYPDKDHKWELAKFFAAVLTRRLLGAELIPTTPSISITFAHPVPDTPVSRNRIFYRSLPDRYTHTHRAPWMSKGVLQIAEDNTVTPRFWDGVSEVEPCTTTFGGVEIRTDYVL